MSRYYDPVTHRFLNADGYFQSGNGILDTNMNAYCRNNPIVNYDSDGRIVLSTLIIGAVVGGINLWWNRNSRSSNVWKKDR